MGKSEGINARIVGLGKAVPDHIVTNADLEKQIDTTNEWIVSRTGIRERRILSSDSGLDASDLGTQAARQALAMSKLEPQDLDMIICASFTPDKVFPSTACLIQQKLKASRAGAFDVQAACSGFVYGLSIADGFIRSGQCKNILVLGSEIISKVINWKDRSTCVLFGDGAGAVVVSAEQGKAGVLATYLGADGNYGSLLEMELWREPRTIKMNGSEIFKQAVRSMGDAALTVIDRAGLKPEDVDLLIPHQANIRIIEATTKRLKLDPQKVFVNIDKYGNTSAASIPIALQEAHEQGRIKAGQIIVLVAFGGGLTWGAVAMRW